jgi:nitrogen fixation/metabolism regulation signal transduction histidine kinase
MVGPGLLEAQPLSQLVDDPLTVDLHAQRVERRLFVKRLDEDAQALLPGVRAEVRETGAPLRLLDQLVEFERTFGLRHQDRPPVCVC